MPDLIQIINIWPENMEVMTNLYSKKYKNDNSNFNEDLISLRDPLI